MTESLVDRLNRWYDSDANEEDFKTLMNELADTEASKATHEISACYFPGTGEVDLTWEDIKTGERAGITVSVSATDGKRIAEVVSPCVYHGAVVAKEQAK